MNRKKGNFIHATCVSIQRAGILIQGPSGSGKSDLALRLIDQGAQLVSDDQVSLSLEENRLIANPPSNIAGLIEVRGLGIIRLPYLSDVEISLVVDCVPLEKIERLPMDQTTSLLGLMIPNLRLFSFEPSALIKIRFALNSIKGINVPRPI